MQTVNSDTIRYLERLRFILRSKSLGFTLAEIGDRDVAGEIR